MAETAELARERLGTKGRRTVPAPIPSAGAEEREVWVEAGLGARPASRPPGSARDRAVRGRRPARLPREVARELGAATESVAGGARLEARLAEAARAYEADRYQDAQRMLAELLRTVPEAAAVRELYGLCLYRRGRWGEAVRNLEAAHRLGGSFDQHPVLADCYRALSRTGEVVRLWEELRAASPGAEVVAEGRIVMAEALAESGDLAGAISLLERSLRPARVTREHHVRQWYALADLYERAGDLVRARALFTRVLGQDAGVADTAERLAALD